MVPSFAVARPQLADIRERRYMQAEGLDSFYFFRVDDCWIVDATKVKETPAALLPPPCRISSACVVVTCRTQKHNQAHCINHSCDPNCFTNIISHHGQKKIVIYAKKQIGTGEELAYDYKFPIETDPDLKIPCHCGAAICRGYMN